MLSRELEVTLNQAFKGAREKRHEFLSTEHLLLNLLGNSAASDVLNACGADIEELRKNLEEFLDANTPTIPETDTTQETQPTLGFQRVLQQAVFHVQTAGRKEVTGANVLVAIFTEQESQAVTFLKQQDINRIDVVNYLAIHSEETIESVDSQYSESTDYDNLIREIEKFLRVHANLEQRVRTSEEQIEELKAEIGRLRQELGK